MRINARLDDEYADRLAFIQQQTNQAVTNVIKSAIELYYQQLQQEQKNTLLILTQTGFIDCGYTDSDLSVNYKSILRDALKAK
ncbi:CopG family transcriptional regulator [Nostoc sp. DedQUE07]|uniref:CopG family transcriptional regulator n=1 Tax=Nostoc sp. DedQUE07 TaxID=3075392 RepID=UPI002AD261DC|nr:CopG family transcriptional regulator [Nostoc sp. DedQUE07]MDZ8127757.1 CopG family transcriptional regulator [Nostoc sp. DedQUE07]